MDRMSSMSGYDGVNLVGFQRWEDTSSVQSRGGDEATSMGIV